MGIGGVNYGIEQVINCIPGGWTVALSYRIPGDPSIAIVGLETPDYFNEVDVGYAATWTAWSFNIPVTVLQGPLTLSVYVVDFMGAGNPCEVDNIRMYKT